MKTLDYTLCTNKVKGEVYTFMVVLFFFLLLKLALIYVLYDELDLKTITKSCNLGLIFDAQRRGI